MGKGEPAKAIADYDRFLALKPDDASGHVNRALAYLKLPDPDRIRNHTLPVRLSVRKTQTRPPVSTTVVTVSRA